MFFLITALQSIMMDTMLSSENKLDSMNTVYYMAPLSFLFLIPFVLYFEMHELLYTWKFNSRAESYAVLIMSGLIAFGLSTYIRGNNCDRFLACFFLTNN